MDAHATTATGMRPAIFGFLAFVILLVVYFGVLSLISGWPFAVGQFSAYWYFIQALAVGFGIHVGLLFNFAGIVYIGNKLFKASREHAHCVA